ncbi:GDP-L-fucose synthase family protein [Azospirillum doebereinerae]|uniref:GDP-L-fucose synthase n=1 Tax=Azospirillum doebereinerae TaxID=92933 RepID=A0A433JF93_9PROT|nr:GDP-L-fucose synthase [Azospirillum doebereinerae]MCG5239008.1 GDP-L-fucose synthase [Azospirillum doebereinerae]RUQ75818.1 GDP-L-fucose synthase [Azospirillum doebereinerae]
MDRNSRIFVAGHRGLVGSAIVRQLAETGYTDLVLRDRSQLDLTDQAAVRAFFDREEIAYVIIAAAKVGGILANERCGADFIRDNLLIQTNVIDAAWRAGVKKLLFLGSSCLYPKHAEQPIKEEALLSGPMEPSNKPYAVAKIAGITMCQAYRKQYGFNAICAMPSNLYGPGDHFEPETSHALPGMIRRFHDAKMAGDPTVTLWGTGTPRREFLYVDDMADACLHLMERYDGEDIVNVGPGEDIAIGDLAGMIRETVGYPGTLGHDLDKPDGHPRKLMDVSRLFATGWRPKIGLPEGLQRTYEWFLKNAAPPAPAQPAPAQPISHAAE